MKHIKDGISLLEILLTISLIGLVIYISAPKVSFLKRPLLITEVDKLCGVITFLQQSAISSNKKQILYFDQNCYLFNDKKEVLNNGIKFGFVEGTKGPPSKAIKLLRKSITFNGYKIVFYPNGKISAGVVYLTDYDKNMFCVSVGVSQVSLVRKYKYDGKKWIQI